LTQLQHLELSSAEYSGTAEDLVSILTSLEQLTSLALNYAVHQSELDALLTHAPQLTSFTCSYMFLTEDRSASPCSWKELVITHDIFRAQTLARTPTGSLTCLVIERSMVLPSPYPTLQFEAWDVSEQDNMLEIVQHSLQNLMRCPAWQQSGPAVHVRLDFDLHDILLSPVLGALAPLMGKEVSLSIGTPTAALGAAQIRQLGFALGSSLTQLELWECDLSPDLWPAIWAHLPGLQQLTVDECVCATVGADSVYGATGAQQLTSFCSSATRPLQLNLVRRLYEQVEGKLDQESRWMGVPHVTVTVAVET
jgi:hypothetical protein